MSNFRRLVLGCMDSYDIEDQGSRKEDQGSRIRWSLENALDFEKKSLQRLLRAIEKTANSRDRRVSREALRKLQTKNEKQEDSVSLGYPLQ